MNVSPAIETREETVVEIALQQVQVGMRRPILPVTSFTVRSGEVTVQACPTDQAPTVLALVAGGQMRPSRGKVTYNGRRLRGKLKQRIAIVDAPTVSEPDDYVTLRRTVAEEYTYIGRVATAGRVQRFLDRHGISDYSDWHMIELPPSVRMVALTELALLRPETEAVIITTPDRHGGAAGDVYEYSKHVASRGYAVLCITGTTAAEELLRDHFNEADHIHLAPEEAPMAFQREAPVNSSSSSSTEGTQAS